MRPDREWFYRFRYRGELSPVGRTRTAPAGGGGALAFAFASCQAWDNGYYGTAGDLLWHDAWDGFPAARNRLTAAWARHEMRAELRVVSTVSRRDAPESVYAKFAVEDGRPGAFRTA